VSKALTDDVYRELHIETQKDQIALLSKSKKRHTALLDSEDEKIALNAVALNYKTTGILPTHTVNQNSQILIKTELTVVDPGVLSRLARVLDVPDLPTDIITIDSETNDTDKGE